MSTRKELMDSELNNISGGRFNFINQDGNVLMQADDSKTHAGKVYSFSAQYVTDVNAYIKSHEDNMSHDEMIDALLSGVQFTDGDGNSYTVKIK